MKADELVAYCNAKARKALRIIPDPYWTTTIYSLGKYLRVYAFYPSWLPLCVYTDHGMRGSHKPAKHELESNAPVQLCFSPQTKAEWEKYSIKPCFVMYSPSVFYRRRCKIELSVNAKGTIAFPAHSTPSLDDVSDPELYIEELQKLPKEFQPVSVCLHMHDINKGAHRIYEKHKMPIYTAGNTSDDRFAERFYEVIKNFKYATSSIPGSYLYYCVEMGIPFSLYGTPPSFINKSDPNLPKGVVAWCQSINQVWNLFSGIFTEISPAQKELVETSLGLKDSLSRLKMAKVLYSSLLKWIISGAGIRFIGNWVIGLPGKISRKLMR